MVYEKVEIDDVRLVQPGDSVHLAGKAVSIAGQIMVELPHVHGLPIRNLALNREWFHRAFRLVIPAPAMPAEELIRAALGAYVPAEELDDAVHVMQVMLEKHIEDEPVPPRGEPVEPEDADDTASMYERELRSLVARLREIINSPRAHGMVNPSDPDGEPLRMVFVDDIEAALDGQPIPMAAPGPLRRKWDGGRGAMLDLNDRIVGYYTPPAERLVTHEMLQAKVFEVLELHGIERDDLSKVAGDAAKAVQGLVYDVVSKSEP